MALLPNCWLKTEKAGDEKAAAAMLAAMSAKDVAAYIRSRKAQDFLEDIRKGSEWA